MFKLKQTTHCLRITCEHQHLFPWFGSQASASPITSSKTRWLPDQTQSPASSFQSIFLGKKRLKHWAARPRKLPEDSLGTREIQADESHTDPGVLFAIPTASPPGRWQACGTAASRGSLGEAGKVLGPPRRSSRAGLGGRPSGARGTTRKARGAAGPWAWPGSTEAARE